MIPLVYLHISPVFQHAHPASCHIYLSTSCCIAVRYKFFVKTKQTPFEIDLKLYPDNKQAVHRIPWEYFSHKPQFSLHFAGLTATYAPQPKECVRALASPPNEVCPEWRIAMHQKIKHQTANSSSLPSFRVSALTQTPVHDIAPPQKDKIDLHIGKDVSREQAATLGALNAQMKTFEEHFWKALTHNCPFTVIHGKGTGKLRTLIYEFVHQQQLSTSIHLYQHEDGGSTTISF